VFVAGFRIIEDLPAIDFQVAAARWRSRHRGISAAVKDVRRCREF